MSISKNIKKLRADSGLSQEDLAEKLHVTRQTVSSWETGHTQPDIDALSALADALSIDVTALIYGEPATAEEIYPKFQKRYVLTLIISAALLLTYLLLQIFWIPHSNEIAAQTFVTPAFTFVYLFLLAPLAAAAVPVAVCSLISLWGDIRLRHKAVRLVILWVSIAVALAFGAIIVLFLGCFIFRLWQIADGSLWIRSVYLWFFRYYTTVPWLAALPGLGMFLGVNK